MTAEQVQHMVHFKTQAGGLASGIFLCLCSAGQQHPVAARLKNVSLCFAHLCVRTAVLELQQLACAIMLQISLAPGIQALAEQTLEQSPAPDASNL